MRFRCRHPGQGPRAHVSRSRFVFGKTTSLIELLSREFNVGCYYSCFVSRELQPIGLFLMMFHLFISQTEKRYTFLFIKIHFHIGVLLNF